MQSIIKTVMWICAGSKKECVLSPGFNVLSKYNIKYSLDHPPHGDNDSLHAMRGQTRRKFALKYQRRDKLVTTRALNKSPPSTPMVANSDITCESELEHKHCQPICVS